jgi:hypothetical protein
MENTNLERHGVEYPLQNENIKNNMKTTNVKKYGVDNPLKNKTIRNKIESTNIKRYGFINPFQNNEIKEKIKITNLDRYGVEYPMQNNMFKEKLKSTSMERYGFDYFMQNPICSEEISKKCYNKKIFIFPCKNTVMIQGYENLALQNLIDNGYIFDDLKTIRTEVPEIWYIKNKKLHRYFCDIYIPNENRIIEVKSTWTYNKNIIINNIKGQTCKRYGYNYEIWIYDGKNNLIKEYF